MKLEEFKEELDGLDIEQVDEHDGGLREFTAGREYETHCTFFVNNEDEVVFEWYDHAAESPEDLIWGRDIGNLFWEAFNLGVKYGSR